MWPARQFIRSVVAVAFLLSAASATAEQEAAKQPAAKGQIDQEEDAVFDLEAFSVLDSKGRDETFGLRVGQRAHCAREPDKKVKAYPKLTSESPWYGSTQFDRDPYEPDSGRWFYFVLDESEGTGKGYDRLHFDANGDLDLTNDPVWRPMKKPPPGAALRWTSKQSVAFDYLDVEFDFGPKLGMRPVKMMPRFVVNEHEGKQYASLGFVPTTARRGKIRIGNRKYRVTLGSEYVVIGRYDTPWAGMQLVSAGGAKDQERWWGADRLGAMRYVGGRWYSLSASPTGDKFFVRPYRGEFGVFEVGPGKRKIEKLAISGSLRGRQRGVPVGDLSRLAGRPEKARRCTLPVGDYAFNYVNVEFGPLAIGMSNNYHADGEPRGATKRSPVFGIKIRQDKPFVLDFSGEPDVMFASPAKDRTFEPGDTIKVAAVLIDPELDLMIRRLNRTAPVEKKAPPKEKAKKKVDSKSGGLFDKIAKSLGVEKSDKPAAPPPRPASASLDPTVTITNSSGKEVARGKMPFG